MAGRFRREGSDALIVFPTSLAAYPLTAASASAPATSWIQVALVSPVEPRGLDITADDFRQMAGNFRAGKYPEPPTGICVDYEHLSLKPSKPGDGKAAGWIVALELRNGHAELWAQVEWTPSGAEAVRSREYQFITPVTASGFVTTAGKQIGTTLLNAALTSNPQLQGRAAPCSGFTGQRCVVVSESVRSGRRSRNSGAVTMSIPSTEPRASRCLSPDTMMAAPDTSAASRLRRRASRRPAVAHSATGGPDCPGSAVR